MLFSGVDCHYRALKPPESIHLRPQTNHNSRIEDRVEIFTIAFLFFVWCSAWWCMIEEKEDGLKSVISHNPVLAFFDPERLGFDMAACAHRCDHHSWFVESGSPPLFDLHTCTHHRLWSVSVCYDYRWMDLCIQAEHWAFVPIYCQSVSSHC